MDVLAAIDRLDDLVHNAKAVPLTDQVRIDGDELTAAVDALLALLPPDASELLDLDVPERLTAIVRDARPVPLTDDVRVDRDPIHDLLDRLRGAVPLALAPATASLSTEAKRLLVTIGDLAALVGEARGLFSGGRARVERTTLTQALDELHRRATPDLRRTGAGHELEELDRLAREAEPARGDRVKVEARPFQDALDRLAAIVATGSADR